MRLALAIARTSRPVSHLEIPRAPVTRVEHGPRPLDKLIAARDVRLDPRTGRRRNTVLARITREGGLGSGSRFLGVEDRRVRIHAGIARVRDLLGTQRQRSQRVHQATALRDRIVEIDALNAVEVDRRVVAGVRLAPDNGEGDKDEEGGAKGHAAA